MQLRATMRGLPWSSGLFQRGLGRPGTSGKSQNDVINGHGDWHDRSGIVTGGMSCFTASRRKRKENRHYCLLGLLLPLWASVLERKKKMETSSRLLEGDTKARSMSGHSTLCLSVCVSQKCTIVFCLYHILVYHNIVYLCVRFVWVTKWVMCLVLK